MLISYPAALALTLEQRFDWGEEALLFPPHGTRSASPLLHRVLSRPLVADRPQPPFDRVTMDGIALNHAAIMAGQRVFPVAGIAAAGAKPFHLNDSAKCVEVMTGAVRPPGTTTVIPYENLRRMGDGLFEVPADVDDRKNIHRTGSDAKKGAGLHPPGMPISGAMVNLLASYGYADVWVKKLPRTAIIATGDELVAVDAAPLPHQIRMSNVYHLQHELSTAGVSATTHHIADDPDLLRGRITELLAENDLLIFSGGVSKGRYDFLPEILAELGVRQLLHRVAQRPGKPLWVGRTDNTMVFGLPGNPVSSLACLLAYVGPWLRQNLGNILPYSARTLDAGLMFDKPLTLFQLARIQGDTQGIWPLHGNGSGDTSSLLNGDGFAILPADKRTFLKGKKYPFIRFGDMLNSKR